MVWYIAAKFYEFHKISWSHLMHTPHHYLILMFVLSIQYDFLLKIYMFGTFERLLIYDEKYISLFIGVIINEIKEKKMN